MVAVPRDQEGACDRDTQLVCAAMALVGILLFCLGYHQSRVGLLDGVDVTPTWVQVGDASLYARVYRARSASPDLAPGVIVFHGYLGNSSVMEVPFSLELARRGFVVLAPDYSGHGRSGGGIRSSEFYGDDGIPVARGPLHAIVDALRAQPGVDPERIVVLGHSAGARAAAFVASVDTHVVATAYMAGFLDEYLLQPAKAPRNLLLVYGGDDDYVPRADLVAKVNLEWLNLPGTLTGDFASGTARRYDIVPSLDHYSVLFSPRVRAEIIEWLATASGIELRAPVRVRPLPFAWIAVAYGGLLLGLVTLLVPRTARAVTAGGDTPAAAGGDWGMVVVGVGCIGATSPMLPWWIARFEWLPASGAALVSGCLWTLGTGLAVATCVLLLARGRRGMAVHPVVRRDVTRGLTLGVACWVYLTVGAAVLAVHYFDPIPTWRRIGLVAGLAAIAAPPVGVLALWVLGVAPGAQKHATPAIVLVIGGLAAFTLQTHASFPGIQTVFWFLVLVFSSTPVLFLWCGDVTRSVPAATAFGTLTVAWVTASLCPFY